MLSIAVWGGGSLGLLWAARLARIFPETVLLVRTKEQRDWIREKGIRLTDLAGKEERIPVHVRWIGEVGDEAFDCLLIMVKQRHLPGVAEALAAFSRLPALAVLWQNGLGQEEAFESLFPPGVLLRSRHHGRGLSGGAGGSAPYGRGPNVDRPLCIGGCPL